MTTKRDDLIQNIISEALERTNRRVLMRYTEWFNFWPVLLTLKVIFFISAWKRPVTKVFSMTMNQDDLNRNFISEALE